MPEAILYQNGKILSKTAFSAPCLLSSLSDRIPQPCGGKGYCGKCRIRVRGSVSRMTTAEREKLSKAERTQGYRLACQTIATGNVSIYLPESVSPGKAAISEVQAASALGTQYGFVLDLGTTTLAVSLYDQQTGKMCGSITAANPQNFDGADVLTRLDHAIHGDKKRLSVAVQHALYDACATLLMEHKLAPNDVDAAVLVGNTAMLYLLFEVDPSPISVAPFRCETRFGGFYDAGFLPVRKGVKLYVPPCISAFLGADASAAVLGSRIWETDSSIVADLGTNAEMILHKEDRFYGCSCAAGPAFEGVGLSCGMPAVDGAICSVRLSGGYYVNQTIGKCVPKGFCGSGFVDLIACMLRSGDLQPDGSLATGDRFYLSDAPLYISQQDVRAFQLAKSAVRTGLEVLCRQADEPVRALRLAGSFGSFLHLPDAARIGLIPPALQTHTNVCGNAAATGGAMLLLDRSMIRTVERIAEQTETIQLADLPDFQDMLCRFIELR